MGKTSQQRAIDAYRRRLREQGVGRFEVMGRDQDRELIRSVARKLAEGGQQAERLREAVGHALGGAPARKGGIVRALLASPLSGSGLKLSRPREAGRKVDI